MASKSYNGWSAKDRDRRYKQFCEMRERNLLPKPDSCQLCGVDNHGQTGFHAEEYGPTMIDYLRNLYWLCPVCHGFLHIRHQYPNRWYRYRQKILLGHVRRDISNMGQFFGLTRGLGDISPKEDVELGNWSDHIGIDWYDGPEKTPKRYSVFDGELILIDETWDGIDFLKSPVYTLIRFDPAIIGTGNEHEAESS